MMAMKRSHDIADNVKTDDVRQVTIDLEKKYGQKLSQVICLML